jgi:UDPglucose 6-dehydrogenase
MNVGFVGLGKLGLPCALAIEARGHKVCGYDIDPRVKEILDSKQLPYREIWAQEHLDNSKIDFASLDDVVERSDVIFVPIQTPHDPLYEGTTRIPDTRVDFDYTWLVSGMRDLSAAIDRNGTDKVVIIISTVLPGTVDSMIRPVISDRVKLCYNPFFIAMGTTMRDFLNPEFVLFGVDDENAAKAAESLYKTLHDRPFFKTSIKNAELIKVCYNTFIGMKIVFINTVMEICEKTGADVDAVSDALALANERVISEKYLRGGMGDGGGCHPRDNIALSWLARKLDLSHDFFEDLMVAREDQTEWFADLIENYDLPKFILGKAFKPETNLTVGSPAVLLKNILEERGIAVTCYDPHVDLDKPKFTKAVYFIGTRHDIFATYKFPAGSVVLDPHRYIPDQDDVTVIRIGQSKK